MPRRSAYLSMFTVDVSSNGRHSAGCGTCTGEYTCSRVPALLSWPGWTAHRRLGICLGRRHVRISISCGPAQWPRDSSFCASRNLRNWIVDGNDFRCGHSEHFRFQPEEWHGRHDRNNLGQQFQCDQDEQYRQVQWNGSGSFVINNNEDCHLRTRWSGNRQDHGKGGKQYRDKQHKLHCHCTSYDCRFFTGKRPGWCVGDHQWQQLQCNQGQ